MNYGHYFRQTRSAGIASYQYVEFAASCADADDASRYPVSVSLTPTGVFFYENSLTADGRLVHKVALALPVLRDTSNNTSRVLAELYNSRYDTSRLCPTPTWHQGYAAIFVPADAWGEKRKNCYFLRKLLLDFMFDLEHSQVFGDSPYFDTLYAALHAQELFSAIWRKAEYYYQRRLAESDRQADAARRRFLADYYSHAESEWSRQIIQPGASDLFALSQGWFRQPEDEMNTVYSQGCASYFRAIGDCQGRARTDSSHISARILTTAKQSVDWYLRRYCFEGVFRVWTGCHTRLCYGVFISFFLLILLFITLPVGDWKYSAVGLSCGTLLLTGAYVGLRYRRSVRGIGVINLLLPRLFASIVTAWLTFALGEEIFKNFLDKPWTSLHALCAIALLLTVVLLFIYYEISRLCPTLEWWRKGARAVSLVIIALTYSFVTGLFFCGFFGISFLDGDYTLPDFRNILMQFSFFAMFIGIFLQLIFDEKPITQPMS